MEMNERKKAYDKYVNDYFTQPTPSPRYKFIGLSFYDLTIGKFDQAVKYYSEVLGVPSYSEDFEGGSVRGWKLGNTWLSIFEASDENAAPSNSGFFIEMENKEEALRLQKAFIEAGGSGPAPSEEFMYVPMTYCPVKDPFGTEFVICARGSLEF